MKSYHHFCLLVAGTLFFLPLSLCRAQALPTDSLQAKADSLYEQKEYGQAAELYSELFDRLTGHAAEKGNAAYHAGKCYRKMSEFEKADHYQREAAAIFSQSGMWNEFYDVQSEQAMLAEKKGDYTTATGLCKEVLLYYAGQKDTAKALKECGNLAYYYYYTDHIREAIDLHIYAIEIAGMAGDHYTQAVSYNELGNIWAIDLQNEEKALEYYRKSLQLKIKAGVSSRSLSYSCNNIGISHKNLGRPDSAMIYYRMALRYAVESNEPAEQTEPLINMANLQLKNGNTAEAFNTFRQVLELTELLSIRQKVMVYTNLGILHNKQQNFPEAIRFLKLAAELTDESEDLVDRADLEVQTAIAWAGLDDFENAYHAQHRFSLLKDSIYQRERELELADMLVKYETAEKDKFIAEQNLLIVERERAIEKRNLWLITAGLGFCLVVVVSLFIARRRAALAKTREERNVNRAIFESEQKERVRIARDLHDSIGQKLSVLKMLLSKADPANTDVQKMTGYLDEAAKEVRTISHNLVPEILNFGLARTIEELTDQINESEKISVELEVTPTVKEMTLPRQTEVSIYRIIQEIIGNIIRHAQTETITIRLFTEQNALQIQVKDRGRGFDTRSIDESEGLGWKNIFARIKLVNGQIKVKSRSDSGSEFYIHIPLL